MKEFEEIRDIFEKCEWNRLTDIGINIKDYPEHKMKLLDYSQIDSIKNHPLVNICRGLLVGYDGKIIRKGFTRFYNLGENNISEFDFENSIAFEKADGSLMFIYWCASTNQWEIGTRGTAFAEGPNEWHGTFRAFMLFAMGRTEEQFQSDCNEHLIKDITHLFEAVGPDNKIVTKYLENRLVELGCVLHKTGEDYPCIENDCFNFYADVVGWNSRQIKNYKFNTQEECLESLNLLTDLAEGYVVFNKKTGERVKIKDPRYVAAHRLRGNGLNVNSICELVSMGEVSEYISVFPEDTAKFDKALFEYQMMLDRGISTYDLYYKIESQKEFAILVKDLAQSCVYFTARKLNCSFEHAFNSYPFTKRAEWLKDLLT